MIVQGAFLTGRLRLSDAACPEAVGGKEREPQVKESKVSRTANCRCPISNDKARAGLHEREPHPIPTQYCPQKRWLDRFSRSSHQAVCWQVHITILPSIERETAVKWNGFMLCSSLFSAFPDSGYVVRDRKPKDFVEFGRWTVSVSGSAEDLDRAVDATSRVFKEWRHKPAYDRAKIIRKAADILRQGAVEIGNRMTLDQGKPLSESIHEVTFQRISSTEPRMRGAGPMAGLSPRACWKHGCHLEVNRVLPHFVRFTCR
ncbi:aldehyde dehydrogenase family protein [Neorhizobium galegae]|nr:aldehyde dehydrogenase family protein [Neorhizobium galegae]MCQ1855769.1 aldehyde dehydrogenase family protein [Neorhizobium galegae]